MTPPCLEFVVVSTQTFGSWVRSLRLERRLTIDALAKKVGISKQYLSVLERDHPHPLTGKPVTPKVDLVDRIAKELQADPNEARRLVGYAPERPEEAYDVMDDVVLMFRDESKLTPEEKEKILNIVRTVALGVVNERKDL